MNDLIDTDVSNARVLAARHFYDDLGRIVKVETSSDAGIGTNRTAYSEENRTLLDQVRLLQFELDNPTATVETQQLILARFDECLSESPGKLSLKSIVE